VVSVQLPPCQLVPGRLAPPSTRIKCIPSLLSYSFRRQNTKRTVRIGHGHSSFFMNGMECSNLSSLLPSFVELNGGDDGASSLIEMTASANSPSNGRFETPVESFFIELLASLLSIELNPTFKPPRHASTPPMCILFIGAQIKRK
jgi:hypothetical protein